MRRGGGWRGDRRRRASLSPRFASVIAGDVLEERGHDFRREFGVVALTPLRPRVDVPLVQSALQRVVRALFFRLGLLIRHRGDDGIGTAGLSTFSTAASTTSFIVFVVVVVLVTYIEGGAAMRAETAVKKRGDGSETRNEIEGRWRGGATVVVVTQHEHY